MRLVLLALVAWVLAAPAAWAIAPSEMLKDPVLEHRARELSKELRCPKCQNQSLDDSEADIARDLRRIVRERMVAGDSNQEIKDYLVARYGEFVLLKPPVKESTWILWFGPLGLAVIGAFVIWQIARRGRAKLATEPDRGPDDEETTGSVTG
ncbi:MAG: cytochrome c-type biogenesis protein CcmH [Alphaproteobacteria bacterium]|nr:cytochrome c-type biogenesis protein CcmH [Alphaproteobacteria bacterium]MCB9930658.1 cytochrome c-type biogenesis protein CcmH [Alphaproteobacteria bacterium]